MIDLVAKGHQQEWVSLATSADIYQILEKKPKGTVHSIFTNSFNLVFGGCLVHIGGLENGLAPFGIGLNQSDARQLTRLVQREQPVHWNPKQQTLIFAEGMSLKLDPTTVINHTLSSRSVRYPILKDNYQFVAQLLLQNDWQTGFAADQKEIIDYLLFSPTTSSPGQIIKEMNNLELLAVGKKAIKAEAVFNYWIGRGLGLTPSGDDVITGVCAILSMLEGINQTFLSELHAYIKEFGHKRTTDVAVEYLEYATEKKFHLQLLRMCAVFDKPRDTEFLTTLNDIKKIGHTSGVDTLLGMLLAIKAVALDAPHIEMTK